MKKPRTIDVILGSGCQPLAAEKFRRNVECYPESGARFPPMSGCPNIHIS